LSFARRRASSSAAFCFVLDRREFRFRSCDLAQVLLREIGIDAPAKIPVEVSSSLSGPRISASSDRMLRKRSTRRLE
jgi:hypothetical protein